MTTEESAGSSPMRTYVVLEEARFEDNEPYYTVVHRVQARNNNNALRKAFRELREGGYKEETAVLMTVPEKQWRPTPVSVKVREQVVAS